jgi:hypothetical protein
MCVQRQAQPIGWAVATVQLLLYAQNLHIQEQHGVLTWGSNPFATTD